MKYTRADGPPSSRFPSRWVRRLSSWLVLSTALTLGQSQAASLYWDGTGTSWNSAANWSTLSGATTPDPLLVPGSADLAIFNTTGLVSPQSLALDADQAALGLVFNTAGTVSISGANLLTLGRSGVLVDFGAGAATISAGVALASAQSWTNGSASVLTIGGDISKGANLLTLGAHGSGGITLSGNIVGGGAGGVTVNSTGAGVVTVSGSNTFTGPLTVAGGNVTATSNAGALGAATAVLNLVAGNLTFTNASGSNIAFTNGTTTVSGTTTITSDVTSAGTAANTYTLNALNIGAQQLSIVRGANATGTAGVTFAGVATLSAHGATFDVGANANLTLNTLTGAFHVFKQGAGTLTLSGTAGARASGNAYVTSGTLVIAGTGNGATSDSFSSAAGAALIVSGGATIDLASGTAAATGVAAHPVTLLGNATILSNANAADTAGFTQTLGVLTVMSTGAGAKSLTIGTGGNITSGTATVAFATGSFLFGAANFSVATGAQLTLNGSLSNGGNALAFSGGGNITVGSGTSGIGGGGGVTMSGTGILTLSGNSSYSGAMSISSGTVVLNAATALNNGSTIVNTMANVILTGTGVLSFNNQSAILSAISSTSGAVIQNGGATTDSTLTIAPGANNTSILNGTLQNGAGTKVLGLTINGQGAVTLGGTNTYTGATTLSTGRLNLNSSGALGATALNVGGSTILDNTSASAVSLTSSTFSALGAFTFGGTNDLSFSASAPSSSSRVITVMGTTAKTISFGGWTCTAGATNSVIAVPGSNSIVNLGAFTVPGNATFNVQGNLLIGAGITTTPVNSAASFSGGGTVTLNGVSNFTGTMTMTGATVILDATVPGGASLATTAASVVNSGGNFTFKGDNVGTGQTLPGVNFGTSGAGASTIQVISGNAVTTTLGLGTMGIGVNGTTVNIKLVNNGGGAAAVTTSNTVTTAILGARGAITVTTGSTTEFATKSGSNIVPYTGQTAFTGTTSVTATNYSVADSQTLSTAASTPNSIKITTSVDDGFLDLGANTMKITSGGILFTGANTGYEIKGTNPAALSAGTGSNTDLIIHNFGTGGLKISAVIADGAGAQTLTLDGPGTTTLSGANTYTGQTWVSGGAVVSISADNNLGLDTGTPAKLTLANGTLKINTNDVSLAGAITARPVDLTGAGGTFDTNGFTLTVAGVVAGAGSLTKIGAGTLYLNTAAATYTGPYTNIQNGGLQIGSTSGISTTTYVALGGATGNSSGVLMLGDGTGIKNQTVAGLFTLGSGPANAVVGGNAGVSTLTYTGTMAVPSTFNGGFGGTGTNQNNVALTITFGVLTLNGASTMAGGVSLAPATNAGSMILNINHGSALGSGTLTVGGMVLGNSGFIAIDNTSGSDITLSTNNAVTLSNEFRFGGTNGLNFGPGSVVTEAATRGLTLMGNSGKALTFGTWNITAAGQSLTVNGTQGSNTSLNIGTLNLNSSGTAGSATILAGSGVVNVTTITETAVGTPFTYNGTGTLTVNGTASYTGATVIGASGGGGTVRLGPGGNLPTTNTVTVTSGILDLNGQNQAIGTLTLGSAGLITNTSNTASTLTANIAAATSQGHISGNLSAVIAASAAATMTGNLTNTGALSFSNSSTGNLNIGGNVLNGGNVTFSAGNTGGFAVSAGSFNPAGGIVTNNGTGSGTTGINGVVGSNVTAFNNTGASALSITGAVFLNSGGLTVTQSGTGTLTVSSPAINGAGNLTVINNSATGAVAFSAIPSFTGNLIFQANSTGTITVSAANINNSGTIANNGSGSSSLVISGVVGPSVTGFIQNSASSKVTLAGANTYTGLTDVVAGKVIVSGSIAGSTRVAAGTHLASGNNTTSTIAGSVSLLSSGIAGGTLAPGDTGDTAGTTTVGKLSVNGNLSLGGAGAPAHLAIEIGGSTGGTLYDQIQVAASSTVALTNVHLDLSLANNFNPTTLTRATFNTGTNQFNQNGSLLFVVKGSAIAIAGQFANVNGPDPGLAGFGTYNVGGQIFAISYQANFGTGEFYDTDQGGHDIALMAIPEPNSLAMVVGSFAMALGVQRFRRRLT